MSMTVGCPNTNSVRTFVAAARPPAVLDPSVTLPENPSDEQLFHAMKKAPGGVVTALLGTVNRLPCSTWFAPARSAGDRLLGAAIRRNDGIVPINADHFGVRLVPPDSDQDVANSLIHGWYNVFCNPALWLIHHEKAGVVLELLNDAPLMNAAFGAYTKVCAEVAGAMAEEVNALPPSVDAWCLVEDYQMYGVAPVLRRLLQRPAAITIMNYSVWPDPLALTAVPSWLRDYILLECFEACDLVGNEIERDRLKLLDTYRRFYPNVVVERGSVIFPGGEGRAATRMRTAVYPLSIDAAATREMALSGPAQEMHAQMRARLGPRGTPLTCEIVTVGRVDVIKEWDHWLAVLEGGLECLEGEHPEVTVHVTMYLQPSRLESAGQHFVALKERIIDGHRRLNARFGHDEYEPLELTFEESQHRALGVLSAADVAMFLSIEGQNLLAKELAVITEASGRHAVLVVADMVGASEELAHPDNGALVVSHAELEAKKYKSAVSTLVQAVLMSSEERARRSTFMADVVAKNQVAHWARSRADDLHIVSREHAGSNPPRPATHVISDFADAHSPSGRPALIPDTREAHSSTPDSTATRQPLV
jgi:trehalose-6-phosphate synthase